MLVEADRERHGTLAAAERERYGSVHSLVGEVYGQRVRAVKAEAADALRTLAAITDEVSTVESLGGLAGRRALAASVYDRLRGADGEWLRELADRIEVA